MSAALTLVIPAKSDPERDRVADAWSASGGEVVRLDRFWEPPRELDPAAVRLYGNDTFCLVVAQVLGLTLISPDERLLVSAPAKLLGRRVCIRALSALRDEDFPRFVKPVVPKQFRARVYDSCEALATECAGLPGETEVLVSDVVTFACEARAFVLDSTVRAASVYEGEGDVHEAEQFAERAARLLDLPRTCVLDVGQRIDGRWVLIEANATWGAGLNGCDPAAVITCIAHATTAPPAGEIYVRLLGEGTTCYRPVPASWIEESTFVLGGDDIYDPENEAWEYAPGTRVTVAPRILSGETVLVAVAEG